MRVPIEAPDRLAFPLRPSLDIGANRKYPGEPGMLQSLLFLSGPRSGPGEDHVAGTLAGKTSPLRSPNSFAWGKKTFTS